nr:protein unc-45 homolog A-like isoform X1 [Coffea arabica]
MNVNNKIERAHQMYREGKYQEALVYYTEALSAAKSIPQQIALHSNRAACFLKLHNFKKAAEECTWVLELDHNHTGALMLRAQTLVTLKEYNSALFDVNRLIDLNPSSEVYQNLQARLKTQLSLAPIPEDDAELEEDEDDTELQVDKEVKERKALEECEDGVEQVTEAVVPDEQRLRVVGLLPEGRSLLRIVPLVSYPNKIPLGGKLSQNRKDTHNLTTQGGIELQMNPAKMMTKIATMILSPSTDSE